MMPAERWVFAQGKSEISAPIRPRLSVNTAEAAIDAAVAGIGLTRVLSYQAAQALSERLLETVLADFQPPPAPVNWCIPAAGCCREKCAPSSISPHPGCARQSPG